MNDFTVNKIKLKDLESFVQSDDYKKFKTKPISINRVKSYISNPRKNPDRYVLYLALDEDQLIGFRSILHDQIFIDSKQFLFGWFSGNWVNPVYRRKGISTLLYKEVKKDWDERLMYTNYAPASKALYDKSSDFELFCEQKGIRVYFKPIIYSLLKDRLVFIKYLRWVVFFFELGIKLFMWPTSYLSKKRFIADLNQVEYTSKLNTEISTFIANNNKSVFKRGEKEYRWVENYPWVKSENSKILYPFSYNADKIDSTYLIQKDKGGAIVAIALVKNIDGKVKVPVHVNNSKNSLQLAKAIIGYSYKNKANLLTVFNKDLVQDIRKLSFVGIFKKSMVQKYFIMKHFLEIINIKNDEIQVQDGDGDVIFT